MGPYRHRLSRTLPKDFAFYPEPRTPERPARELDVPPPPQHNSHRSRKPRLDILSTFEPKSMPFCSPDVPLPSIEVPNESVASFDSERDILPHDQSSSYLQVPSRERLEFRTPPAQIRDIAADESFNENYASAYGNSISRPSSACSNASNSSASSCESYLSRPSVEGSCTSLESDSYDPFFSYPLSSRKEELQSPSRTGTTSATDFGSSAVTVWTSDMDNHLWNTYQIYLQNPMITPFKTVPGSIPPLGVSHRVAREARRTWPKIRRTSPFPAKVTKHKRRSLYPDTFTGIKESPIDTGNDTRSGSTTPTASTPKAQMFWPRSNASTRRRLKELCKRKFSIAPHYQRMIDSRSPSPFPEIFGPSESQPQRPWTSAGHTTTSFARDLGVSLVSTSLSTAMPTTTAVNMPGATGHDWLSNAVASTIPSSVLPAPTLQTFSNNPSLANPREVPRLGSPFAYHTWGPDKLHRRLHRSASMSNPDTMHVTGVRLRSPIPEEMYAGANKRRAISRLDDEVNPNGRAIQPELPELLSDDHKNINQRRVRLRNRGATTSAVGQRERLQQLFTPPSQFGSSGIGARPSSSSQSIPSTISQANDIKRLGSPFSLRKLPRSRHAPSRSEPFVASNIVGIYPQHGQDTPLTSDRYQEDMSYTPPGNIQTQAGRSSSMDPLQLHREL